MINYSCHLALFREGEQFVSTHSLGMVLSGVMELDDGLHRIAFGKGDIFTSRRNHLVKFKKLPEEKGEFMSISIYFDDDVLREVSMEQGYTANDHVEVPAFAKLPSSTLLISYIQSLQAYKELPAGSNALIRLKQKEGVLLLLQQDPTLRNVLFDFSVPGKLDLEAFMKQNYHFNVKLERFAYLTGRSLSTFKRDFERIFHETPSKWLLNRRLREAYYLIKEKKKQASDIYLDLGFEDLSHFSYTFKKQFGAAPSKIA
ncbi:MAG: helix-turn-helix transcriptional regulator [Filimonas sp.]|nr:helix-turn-helix transcriptional regulator [Filimonas sp.]